jgi:hypothetical protein
MIIKKAKWEQKMRRKFTAGWNVVCCCQLGDEQPSSVQAEFV